MNRVSTSGPLTVEDLANLAVESVSALAPVLGLVPCEVLARLKSSPPGLTGMAVRVEGTKTLVVVSVLSNAAGRSQIARALFQMEAHQEPPPVRDEDDAMGEVANVLAGQIKAATVSRDHTMRLTPPEKITGEATGRFEHVSAIRVSFGGVAAAIVVALP
jgi:CheY-specific phosphatase CheX